MIEALERRIKRYGVNHFTIYDANFPLDKGRMRRFCWLMQETGLHRKIFLQISTSVSLALTDEEIAELKSAGVSMVCIGVERFDDAARRAISKPGTCDQAQTLIRKFHDAKIKTIINILLNLPSETPESLAREGEIIERNLAHISLLFINYLIPMPGTAIFDENNPAHHWYLNKSIDGLKMSYYQMCIIVSNPALELNPFALPAETIKAMRRFKEYFHMKSAFNLYRSPLFKLALICDFIFAKISFYIARISVDLERAVFCPLIIIRSSIYKWTFNFIGKNQY
jgi:radical SAM superfamily enzyme YgiQ (UPF0313 family)